VLASGFVGISTVVFDLGGVVCRYQPELRLQELARISGRTPEDVHQLGPLFDMIWWGAEGEGFEPSVRCRTRDFQSRFRSQAGPSIVPPGGIEPPRHGLGNRSSVR
jgi:hypothetical protein